MSERRMVAALRNSRGMSFSTGVGAAEDFFQRMWTKGQTKESAMIQNRMRGALRYSATFDRSIHPSEFSIRGFAAMNRSTKTQLRSTGTIQAASPLANAGRLN